MKPKDALYKAGTRIHLALFNISKGRLFGKVLGMPFIELITTGRRSGKERVTMAGATRIMVARTATEEERAELWPRITSTHGGYARYQKRTERRIPVVI